MATIIRNVLPGSLGERYGLREGDEILEINNKPVTDYLDYMYLSSNETIKISLADRTVTIKNGDFEPLGIEFDTLLIDEARSCMNKCIFCFIDQLPPGMRESCYFKDDDYRLSFLQGNYVTLTNMKDSDIDRIIEFNLPRINVSVHTTNPELRVKMLRNKNAGRILEQIKRFADGGMTINCQIVLCRGYNDKAELDRTIGDLTQFGECIESLSIVPVGISDYREGLAKLEPFDRDSSAEVIDRVERWQKKLFAERGINFVYLSDEFYIMADREIPPQEAYDGFPQIENGVGLCASLEWEFDQALSFCDDKTVKTEKSIATGYLAFDFMKRLVDKLGSDKIKLYKIKNDFFGEKITVSGLVTAGDIIKQLSGEALGKTLLIPSAMLRHDENVFLDDLTTEDVERALGVDVIPVQNDGFELLDELLK